MNCGEAQTVLVLRARSVGQQARLDTHLRTCQICREAAAMLRSVPIETNGGDVAPTSSLKVGDLVERYRIDAELGSGGMGVVFAATHTEMRQRVAIKVLHRDLASSVDANARFMRDAVMVARLRGEHVCRINTFGRLEDGEPYMILELLDGEDLARQLQRVGAAPVATAVDDIIQACAGLAEAHALGIVHRDVKPANLFCTRHPDGSRLIKILDFGIAKARLDALQAGLTRTGMTVGSLPYMSPEQLRSAKSVDSRADIWSLGATLHHLLSNALPFPASGPLAEVAIRIWSDPPRRLPARVPPGLAAVVTRTLEKIPDDRHRDVAELASALAPFGGPTARCDSELVARIVAQRAAR